MATDARALVDEPGRSKTMATIAQYMESSLLLQNSLDTYSQRSIGPVYPPTRVVDKLLQLWRLCSATAKCRGLGTYVTMLYFAVKLLYCGNVIVQFILLHYCLGTSNALFGFDLLRDLAAGRDWFATGLFPRVTLCDFEVGPQKRVQCLYSVRDSLEIRADLCVNYSQYKLVI